MFQKVKLPHHIRKLVENTYRVDRDLFAELMMQARIRAKQDMQEQLRDLFEHFDKDANGTTDCSCGCAATGMRPALIVSLLTLPGNFPGMLDEHEFSALTRCSFPFSISNRQAELMWKKGMELKASFMPKATPPELAAVVGWTEKMVVEVRQVCCRVVFCVVVYSQDWLFSPEPEMCRFLQCLTLMSARLAAPV